MENTKNNQEPPSEPEDGVINEIGEVSEDGFIVIKNVNIKKGKRFRLQLRVY